jgi:hypothetical protein
MSLILMAFTNGTGNFYHLQRVPESGRAQMMVSGTWLHKQWSCGMLLRKTI